MKEHLRGKVAREQGYRETAKKGEEYREMMTTKGWAHLEQFLRVIYMDAFSDWRDSKNPDPDGKARVQVVDAIFREIGNTFNSAEHAKNQLLEHLKRN